MQRLRLFFAAWGHYVLALMCVAAILLSALWTRDEQRLQGMEAPAHVDQAQRLSQVTPSPAPVDMQRPVEGKVVRPFSQGVVHFEKMCCYGLHPSTDVQVQEGEKVLAAFDGKVTSEGERVCLSDGEFTLWYEGIRPAFSGPRQVKKGMQVGVATGGVAWEGEGILCLTLYRQGEAKNIEAFWE